ncbi:phosphatase PAP2 family protein [Natronococcus occultus]|uniref:Membrane-associated phospholipid phosphatase n=1 Tax=Natronococcus occultus SP4 TaxID=694430 RepID=L0JYG6_9EURY|nr:phosphatase PAP2 family protein [Natronococcus occultus]AGB36893.1 membrane-associated phospholipid phosphatase [Natronococcus occultus SP4]
MYAEVLTQVLTQVAAVVAFLLVVSVAAFVGRERLVATVREWRPRVRASAPAFAVLLVVLWLNRVMRQAGPGISERIGVHMTETFYDLEGEFVLVFQSIATGELTAYFSFIYVYGYAFLLIFPGIAYFALSDTRAFRRLLTAYSLNYVIGLAFYLLVIAYGPRNVMPEELTVTMLYDNSPEYQHLTREVNRNTNVFPSLHTSLAATVGIFAYETRSSYPKWFPIAVVLAVSVALSTMYLGIHWAIDVVAGLALAVGSVWLSNVLVGRRSIAELRRDVARRLPDRDDRE